MRKADVMLSSAVKCCRPCCDSIEGLCLPLTM